MVFPSCRTEAQILVPDWGDKVDYGNRVVVPSCRTSLPAYVAGQAGTTTLNRSQLYPPSQGLGIWQRDAGAQFWLGVEINVWDERLARTKL